MKNVLVFDVGTTHLKATVFGNDGDILYAIRSATPYSLKTDIQVELDAIELLSRVKDILISASSKYPLSGVIICGMASSVIPVDQSGNPLHSCICWNDNFSFDMNQVDLKLLSNDLQQFPIPMYLPFRARWLIKNDPSIRTQTYKWLNITDFLNYHLSSNKIFLTDYSIASRTMVFDSIVQTWSQRLLDYFGISSEQLPIPKPAGSIVGELDISLRTKDLENTLLILGGHDHMCAACATDINAPSTVLLSTGTSGAVVRPLNNRESINFFEEQCGLEHHVLENSLVLVTYVTYIGKIFDWAHRYFGLLDWEQDTDFMKKLLKNVQDRPIFVPPYRRMNPNSHGGLTRLALSTDFELSYSILEGLCFETKAIIERQNRTLSLENRLVRVVGGLTNSSNFLQLQATVLGDAIEIIDYTDMASMGGFILCKVALNSRKLEKTYFSDLVDRRKRVVEPLFDYAKEDYTSRYETYLSERMKLDV
ncbi:hypothetical protein LLE49_25675 [Alicyclobacillus tolerans]|uniref:FGGY-family carbohydrate kinase n=1 Tax=Alicyclobacillus tolerans TaxID=90970 RepID=UPI001EFEFF25|nr:FGGY family carbohydrate kinase [Alicyclobacillus tolerans]MCF8568118.1 hypothetical protein [Alicyclobacillus tolerans]